MICVFHWGAGLSRRERKHVRREHPARQSARRRCKRRGAAHSRPGSVRPLSLRRSASAAIYRSAISPAKLLLARLDFGGVACVTPTIRPPSVRAISAACILSGRSPRANSAKAWANVASEGTCERPTEDATERLVDGETLDQGVGSGNAQHCLGDEGPGEGAAILGRASGAAGAQAQRL
jgi:hypothetical protein